MNITEMLGLQDERMSPSSGSLGGWVAFELGSSTTRPGWTPGDEQPIPRSPTASCSAWLGWRPSTAPTIGRRRWCSRGSSSRPPCACADGWDWLMIGWTRCWPPSCGWRSAACRGGVRTGWPRRSPVSCVKGCCWTAALRRTTSRAGSRPSRWAPSTRPTIGSSKTTTGSRVGRTARLGLRRGRHHRRGPRAAGQSHRSREDPQADGRAARAESRPVEPSAERRRGPGVGRVRPDRAASHRSLRGGPQRSRRRVPERRRLTVHR